LHPHADSAFISRLKPAMRVAGGAKGNKLKWQIANSNMHAKDKHVSQGFSARRIKAPKKAGICKTDFYLLVLIHFQT
jgi:hypothetical protein